jgi:hypothetical protein
LRNSYEGAYGGDKYKQPLRLINAQFEKLYNEEATGNTFISAETVYDFQRLCGLYDGEGGTLIAQKTLQALIDASGAGENWKKVVVGKFDEKPSKNYINIQNIWKKLSRLKIYNEGINLRSENDHIKLLREAYSCLGFDVKGDNLTYANYKMQILSGVDDRGIFMTSFGKDTRKALLTALKAAGEGKDWKAALK